ncbi:hypothetical protein KC669_01255 [Candidatus Dojkabacteria bacterium]|uniref:Uncharacterized protein n=1 Tax=Candidatus Dojkabacteria bacterium TaxID=2099670 RepID=A0A955LAM2_9BACT|nr:hypothetical protein [Candidatus Dojkabacteria bacterium]
MITLLSPTEINPYKDAFNEASDYGTDSLLKRELADIFREMHFESNGSIPDLWADMDEKSREYCVGKYLCKSYELESLKLIRDSKNDTTNSGLDLDLQIRRLAKVHVVFEVFKRTYNRQEGLLNLLLSYVPLPEYHQEL